MANSEIATLTFAWLNQVKRDPTLPASCFKVAFQLTQKTNTEHFEKSGELLSWQGRKTIAGEIMMGERTVHDMIRRLETAGHLYVQLGHGPGNSNRYRLVQMRQSTAAINEAVDCRIGGDNGQSAAALNRQSDVANAAVQRSKCGSPLPPNDSSNDLLNKSADAPRSEVSALPAWAKPAGNGKYFVQIESEGGDLIAQHCSNTGQKLPFVSNREGAYVVPYVWPPGSEPTDLKAKRGAAA